MFGVVAQMVFLARCLAAVGGLYLRRVVQVCAATLALVWPPLLCAQTIPSVRQWVSAFDEVHQHPLFKDLNISYGKTAAEGVGYSPVGVIPQEGVDCVVIIAEGANPKMERILTLIPSPEATQIFIMAMAAHEFGHCFRMRQRHLTADLWTRALAAAPDSAERLAMEKRISIEEGYADAYAFAYLREAHAPMYGTIFATMHRLRHEPAFATAFYQVEPLYVQLSSRGLDASLPPHQQVEAIMKESKFEWSTVSAASD